MMSLRGIKKQLKILKVPVIADSSQRDDTVQYKSFDCVSFLIMSAVIG